MEDIKNNIDENSNNISKVNRDERIILFGFNGDTDYAIFIEKKEGSADGERYKTYMNVNDAISKNASQVEMGVLHTYLSLNGEIPNGLSSFPCDRYEGQSMYDKKDYLSYIKWLTECLLSSNYMIQYSILKIQYGVYSKYC